MKLQNKIAIVTGASTGIGQSVAFQFAKQGAFVFLIGRNKKGLIETQRIIQDFTGKSEILEADLSSLQSINQLILKIKSKTKRVDILANIAGVWHGKSEVYAGKEFDAFDQKMILDTYSVGLTAPTLLSHGLIPLMLKNGKIINLSGTFENGAKGWLPYYVSKRALKI